MESGQIMSISKSGHIYTKYSCCFTPSGYKQMSLNYSQLLPNRIVLLLCVTIMRMQIAHVSESVLIG